MRILYLYSELMGYQIPVLKEYVEQYGAEVRVIHWDQKKLTPFVPPPLHRVLYHNRSIFNDHKLIDFVSEYDPDITYVSGWMDLGYLKATRQLIKLGKPVVSGFDDIWNKTLRQRIASLLFPIVRKHIFSHAWVAGPYQYEYAKRLGFRNQQILYNCLSADTNIFLNAYSESRSSKELKYPHRFLFVGRMEYVKGIDILIDAWRNIRSFRKDWQLYLIGSGSFVNSIIQDESVTMKDFMSSEELAEVAKSSGCFVLPSRSEPWGIVMHEFAAAGLPIVCSDVCGAAPVFAISNYNGFVFRANDQGALENCLLKVINTTDDELLRMSVNSFKCGQRISPEIAAASFLSALN